MIAKCFGWAKYWVLALALAMGASPLAGAPAGSSSRYLVIVDTSRSMRHRSKAMLQTVQDLLSSGMQGELSGGETLGLWTFNQDLYTGRFPLQVWAPQEQEAIARRTLDFLKTQGCEKQPRLDKVMPVLEEVVKGSEQITVILISAGDAEMHGTPFDGPINDYYARWYSEQQKGQVPLVTVLRARNGKMIGWSVRPAAGPVDFPPWPLPEAPVARTEPAAPGPVPAPAPAPQVVQPQTAPPLILSGKEPAVSASQESVSSPATEPAPAFPLFDKPIAEAGEAPPPKPEQAPSAPPETGPPALGLVQKDIPRSECPASSVERESVERGSVERGSVERGSVERESVGRRSAERQSVERQSVERGSAERQSVERGKCYDAPTPNAPTLHAPDASAAPPGPSASASTPSGDGARIAQPASVSHVSRIRLWAGSVVAGGCCLAFGLFRLRSAREAPRLSLITCSLDGGTQKPSRSALKACPKNPPA
jgi:hypothetical protein